MEDVKYVTDPDYRKTESKGERDVEKALKKIGAKFDIQIGFKNLVSDYHNLLRYDFIIENKALLEIDGIQHYTYIKEFGSQEDFKTLIKHDRNKNKYAKDNNIPLLRILYTGENHAKVVQDTLGYWKAVKAGVAEEYIKNYNKDLSLENIQKIENSYKNNSHLKDDLLTKSISNYFTAINGHQTIKVSNQVSFENIIKLTYPYRKLLFTLVYFLKKIKDPQNNQLSLNTDYLRKLSKNTRVRLHKFDTMLVGMQKEANSDKYSIIVNNSQDTRCTINLFKKIAFSDNPYIDDCNVVFTINPQVLPYFSNLTSNYSWFPLADVLSIRSRQSLAFYQRLAKARYLGITTFSVKEGRILLKGQSNSYISQHLKRLLKPLETYFGKINVKSKYKYSRKGRTVKSYIITFKKDYYYNRGNK